MQIRAAGVEELPALQDIERAAGQCFRDVNMPEVADDELLPLDELIRYQRAARVWVAVDGTDQPTAYLITDLVDGNLHVEQVSVHPDSARRGVGRSLLEHVADRAAAEGIPALTLTTFFQVPWNAPYYVRSGREVERLTTALPRGRALCRCSPAPPAPETELFGRRTGREPGLGPDGPGGRGTGERGEREPQPEADEHAGPEKRQYRVRSSL